MKSQSTPNPLQNLAQNMASGIFDQNALASPDNNYAMAVARAAAAAVAATFADTLTGHFPASALFADSAGV